MADVVKQNIRARVHLINNEITRYDQEYLDEDREITEHLHNTAVLAAAMSSFQEIDISTVTTPTVLMLETDRAIKVAINSTDNEITLADNGFIALYGTFTAVYVKNEDANYTATVEYVVTG